MKEVTRVELVEKSVIKYVADDGTEFATLRACTDYEQAQNEDKLSMIEQCEAADGNPMFDGAEHTEYNSYHWYRPKNMDEIDILNAVFGTDCTFSGEDIGKWICMEIGMDCAWKSRLDDGIKYVQTILDRLGYIMTVTEKQ